MSLPPPPSDDDVTVDPFLNPEEPAISGMDMPDSTNLSADTHLRLPVPDSNDASEGGKLKMILQLVKRSLGVKDIAAMSVIFPQLTAAASWTVCSRGAALSGLAII